MKDPVEAARLLRESNPVPDDAFAGAADDSLGRATFERIIDRSPEPAPATGRSPRRRRRLALRWLTVATAALAASAVVLVMTAVPGAHDTGAHDNGTVGPAIDAAYVVKRAESALSAAGPGALAQMTVTSGGPVGTITAREWSYGDQRRSVVYSPTGQPVYDEGFSASSVYTLVSYPARTWARQRGLGGPAAPGPSPRGCGQVVAALPWLFGPGLLGTGSSAGSAPATVASALRTAISCGTLAMAGRQRVDGTEAVRLTSRPGSLISETIWVSPGTYLPVRVAVRSGPGAPVFQRTADITWLRPTAQNLAKLTVPIPAGFHQVPLGPTVTPASP